MIHRIVQYPNPGLNVVSDTVLSASDYIDRLVRDMFETMDSLNAVGLSAVQIGVPLRVFVMDTRNAVPRNGGMRCAFINPEIIDSTKQYIRSDEGCLSFRGVRIRVERQANIIVRARNTQFKRFDITLDGINSICAQHEIDHLDGITFNTRATSPFDIFDMNEILTNQDKHILQPEEL